ncbi:MAG: YHS domain-containing protein [Actinomycetota bacterium]
MARDPICGMEVDPETAAEYLNYDGEMYYFCAPACKRKFEAEPGKYLGGKKEPAAPAKQGFWAKLFKG